MYICSISVSLVRVCRLFIHHFEKNFMHGLHKQGVVRPHCDSSTNREEEKQQDFVWKPTLVILIGTKEDVVASLNGLEQQLFKRYCDKLPKTKRIDDE